MKMVKLSLLQNVKLPMLEQLDKVVATFKLQLGQIYAIKNYRYRGVKND